MPSTRPHIKIRSRRERQLRDRLKKAGIWMFLVFFIVSILGVALVAVTH